MTFKKICVLGLGYIGLPTAAMFAANGLEVLGVDVNPNVIEMLRAGQMHIYEPGLGEVFEQALNSGRLSVALAPAPADAFLIAVPTPFYEDETGDYNGQTYKKADLRAVMSACQAIVPHLRRGNLVILESTSPPRTTLEVVVPILEKSGLRAGLDFYVAYSPERVLPGQILRELVENPRIIGGLTPESAQAAAQLYAAFVRGEIHQTTPTTAEMVKLMENTFRDVNIAIANEFLRLAERFEVDVWEAVRLASLHPRVKILTPGPGVGGHCVSVDPWFLVEAAPDLAQLILKARQVNDEQPQVVVEKVRQAFGSVPLAGRKIAVFGLAYKPDVDDLRESPAVEVAYLLQKEAALVRAYEPFKPIPELPGIASAPTLQAALEGVEAVLFLTGHSQFRALQPEQLASLTSARILIDAVQALAGRDWESAGFTVWRLGAPR